MRSLALPTLSNGNMAQARQHQDTILEWSPPPSAELLSNIERMLYLLSKSDKDNRKSNMQKPMNRINELANLVFGFNGWSTEIVSSQVMSMESAHANGPYSVTAVATIKLRLEGGVYHETEGEGRMLNSPTKGQAVDKARKEAVTAAIKRAFYTLGDLAHGDAFIDSAEVDQE